MKPVSMPTYIPTLIPEREISDPKQALIEEWTEWADNAEPGTGENREMALVILKTYFINKSEKLNLSSLNLIELPDHLPHNLTHLNINHNQLTHLPKNLPESLQKILFRGNKITNLPDHLPPHLKELDARQNPLNKLSANFSSSIKILVDKNQIQENYSENKPIDSMKLYNNVITTRIDLNKCHYL